MTIQLRAAPVNGQHNWQPIGMLQQQITIAEAKDEKDQKPLDLGELTLKMVKPAPPTGATGVLEFQATPVYAESVPAESPVPAQAEK